MHWTAILRNQTLPENARIAGDLPCIVCGYNLRRARPGGRCPECGGTVLQTLDAATHPRELGEALRRLGPTFLAALAALLLPAYAAGSWIAPVGAIVVIIGSVLRLISVMFLIRHGGLRPFPGAESRARLLVAAAAIDVAMALALAILTFAGLKALNTAIDAAFGVVLAGWCAVVAAELVLIAMIGRDLGRAFEYAILKWESAALLLLLVGGAALAAAIAFFAGAAAGGDIPRMIAVFMFIFCICTGIPALVLASVLLFHLANAAERVREHLEDLLEDAAG